MKPVGTSMDVSARLGDEDAVLLVEPGPRTYAFRLTDLDGVCEPGPIRDVPGAPRAVVGVAEWRGRLYCVLALEALLEEQHDGPRVLIRLAEPHAGLALLARASLRFTRLDRPGAPADDGSVRLLDPQRLLESVRPGGS